MSNQYATSVTWGGIVYVMRPDDEGRLYGYRVNEDGSEALVTQGYDEEESCYVALKGAHKKFRVDQSTDK